MKNYRIQKLFSIAEFFAIREYIVKFTAKIKL